MPDSLKKRSSFPTNRITDLGLGCISKGSIYYIHNKRIIYSDYISFIEKGNRYDLYCFADIAFDDNVLPMSRVSHKQSDIKIKKLISDKNIRLKTNFNSMIKQGENNNMNNSILEQNIVDLQGFKGLRGMIETEIYKYGIRKVLNHFGVQMILIENKIQIFTEWLEKYDKKFMNHIRNPYMLRKSNRLEKAEINGEFIVKLEKNTYIFVSSKNREYIFIYIFGKYMYKYFKELKIFIEDKTNKNFMKYSIVAQKATDDKSTYWSCVGSELTPRPLSTLFFNDDIKERIINHLDTWLKSEDIYKSRGLIFKTGILLYGTKGTGKSSLATAIATYLNCSVISIDCTTFQYLNISEITDTINADNDRYVVLLDEIDTLFTTREETNLSDTDKAKAAKLLSFLDSQESPTNVIFVATTNYIDRLDPAAIREGRFDLKIELNDINENAARKMCESFEMSKHDIDKIFKTITFPCNPAWLQNKILYSLSDKE